MKFLPFILANLSRRKIRTALTGGSFAAALFLFGMLVVIRDAFVGGASVRADRLVIMNRVSISQPLPYVYKERLLRIPGVTDVTFLTWFGGTYRDKRLVEFALDHESYRALFPEYAVPEEQWRDFLADRAGCIAGEALTARHGWKVGDRIPLKGTIYPGSWEFNLRGVYKGTRPQDDTTQFWFRWDHLNEKAPARFKGYVGWYYAKIASRDEAPRIAKAIDAAFANSPWETRAQTEQAMAASFVKQMGDVGSLVLAIGAVVVFTLLFMTGNTMALAVRERTGEIAVLKSIGFSGVAVLLLVLAESVVVAGAGGGFGLLLAKLLTLRGDPTGGMLASFYLPPGALAVGFALAIGVGAFAGLLPAVRAMRLRVADALRRV